jgi:hypothetical protein
LTISDFAPLLALRLFVLADFSGLPEARVEDLKKKFAGLGYNMLDVDMAAESAAKDPSKTYKDLKVLSHKALGTGKANVQKDDLATANKNFAFAYQMRCVCDWIWKNLLNKQGDAGHAAYLQVSRSFGKLAAGKTKLSPTEQKEIFALIDKIKD